MSDKIVPMTCSFSQLCDLSHDNVEVGNFSIMTDTTKVWLSQQKGYEQTQAFVVDRPTFNKLIRWYTEGIVPKEDKREIQKGNQ